MKLILHPGHSKCGSTTIQKAIIKNRSLLESHDYIIPDPQMRTNGDDGFNPNGETPRAFFRHAMEHENLEPLKAKLERIREKYGNTSKAILISAENLVNQLSSSTGLNIHRVLRDFFDSYEVIYYIRRQDQFIMSAWQQWGYKKGLSLEAFVAHALKVKNPNYRVIVSAFSNLYGKANVRVVPLLRNSLWKGDLVNDFFSRLGIESGAKRPAESIDNKSLNPYICEALSKVSHIFHDIHDESVKHKLESYASGHVGLYRRDDKYLSCFLRKKILEVYADDNQFISENFVGNNNWHFYNRPLSSESSNSLSEALDVMTLTFSKIMIKDFRYAECDVVEKPGRDE